METKCSTPKSGTMSTSLCIDTTKTYEQHPGQEKQCFSSFEAKLGQYIKTKKQRFHCKLHDSGRNQCLTSPGPEEACYHVFQVACFDAHCCQRHHQNCEGGKHLGYDRYFKKVSSTNLLSFSFPLGLPMVGRRLQGRSWQGFSGGFLGSPLEKNVNNSGWGRRFTTILRKDIRCTM